MYLPLAERMTKKYVDEDKIDAEAGERHVRLVNHFVCVCVEIVTLCSCSLAYVCVCVCVCVCMRTCMHLSLLFRLFRLCVCVVEGEGSVLKERKREGGKLC